VIGFVVASNKPGSPSGPISAVTRPWFDRRRRGGTALQGGRGAAIRGRGANPRFPFHLTMDTNDTIETAAGVSRMPVIVPVHTETAGRISARMANDLACHLRYRGWGLDRDCGFLSLGVATIIEPAPRRVTASTAACLPRRLGQGRRPGTCSRQVRCRGRLDPGMGRAQQSRIRSIHAEQALRAVTSRPRKAKPPRPF